MSNFWTGVVEDRDDPLFLGRLRVRIFGIHSELKVSSKTSGSPTENLLWCYTMQPATSAAISGVGTSPTGIVEGSHVVGFFRDSMCQDGVVIGCIPGIPQAYSNPDRGFNDPNGKYPTYINAPDTHILARGGITPTLESVYGGQATEEVPSDVEEQNLNTDKVPEPDKTPEEDVAPTPPPGDFGIEEMLRGDEGVRVKVYWDHLGFPTVGIGHLIIHEKTSNMQRINSELSKQVGRTVTNGRITNEEITKLFKSDLAKVQREIATFYKTAPAYAACDATRKMAMENMAFQLGVGGLGKFTKSMALIAAKKWGAAYHELLDSDWAKQTPGRANRVAKVIRDGNLSSYGVKPSSRLFKSMKSSEYLFEEPKSPYGAKYPYNTVTCSESGHITEIDDTPGAERLHRKHAVGTFEEIHPDGTRVTKIVGEDYLIVKSGRNVQIEGDLKVYIGGNSTISVQGDADLTVQGNVTEFVRGNVDQTIEQNVTQKINGTVSQTIKGNVDSVVTEGNVTQTVSAGNMTQSIKGDVTQEITGSYNGKTDNYTLDVAGNYTVKVGGSSNLDVSGSSMYKSGGATTITGATVSIN